MKLKARLTDEGFWWLLDAPGDPFHMVPMGRTRKYALQVLAEYREFRRNFQPGDCVFVPSPDPAGIG